MKVLNAAQVREWDTYTILQEPIASIDLMERAAARCTAWVMKQLPLQRSFAVFCGKGNNGGDGLAMARMLLQQGCSVSVHILEYGRIGTPDFQENLARLHAMTGTDIHFIQSDEHLHAIPEDRVIIDALFGTGLNRPVSGLAARLIQHLNGSGRTIVSIDLPSGLMADGTADGIPVIRARHTLSFQTIKACFLYPSNQEMIGSVHVLDIGLLPGFLDQAATSRFLLDDTDIRRLYKPRKRSAHKGDLGHALLICGEKGKIGAAVLATEATLRIGAGRVTTQIPACGYEVLQISVPEAMVITDSNDTHLTTRIDDLNRFDAIGIGPGIGTARETENLLGQVITNVNRPMVLDADALNILANRPDLLKALPPCTLLTPHPGEFKRLFGATDNDAQRTDLASSKAIEFGLIIVLKGHHSFIALPDGTGYFNPTGNPGMATAGSGDVLLGILTGLLAQGYPPSEAARLGVFLHGRAGDLAAVDLSEESMLASDITAFLGAAYATVYQPNLRS